MLKDLFKATLMLLDQMKTLTPDLTVIIQCSLKQNKIQLFLYMISSTLKYSRNIPSNIFLKKIKFK